MNLSILPRILGLVLCLIFLEAEAATAQQTPVKTVQYTVKTGDTAMAITRKYHITLNQLLALNPGMKAEHICPNQKINVPASTKVQPSKKNEPLYIEYEVKRKDTAYSLAKKYDITVEELYAANPQLENGNKKLKKGMTIRIPLRQITEKTSSNPGSMGLKNIKVAVLLPIIGDNIEFERSTEFYRGILMGLETLKDANININLTVYNEPTPTEDIKPLLKKVLNESPDVIVGPLYPSHFNDVTAAASQTTKVAIPFSSKVPQVEFRNNVYIINTPAKYEGSLAVDLFMNTFKKSTTIIMLNSINGNKKELCKELHNRLLAAGYKILALPASYSAEQIRSDINNNPQGNYILVPNDDREETFKDLLEKSMVLRKSMPKAHISLVGYETWIPMTESKYKTSIHEANTYILTSNYYYPYTQAAKDFKNNYEKWFKTCMSDYRPHMAPLGYDFSRSFLGGMATYGHAFSTQTPCENSIAALPKLQTDLRFISVGPNGGYLNRSMWLIHFKPDMTILKLAAH